MLDLAHWPHLRPLTSTPANSLFCEVWNLPKVSADFQELLLSCLLYPSLIPKFACMATSIFWPYQQNQQFVEFHLENLFFQEALRD